MEGNKILGKVKIGENDEILISENDIISNKAELLHILESRINHWKAEDVLNIAMAFHNSSDSETFLNILTMSTNPEHSLNLHGTGVVFSINEKKERNLCLLNALASYYILSFIKERDEEKKEQAYNNATTNINRADTIEMCDKRSMINKGFLLFANGQLDVAHQFFSNVLEIQENHILALYGKGAISYNYGKYPEALKYFISILKIAPYSSLPSRMCIGLCHYKLGNIQKAQMAFERQLELDPNNHNCLVYLAIINLNNSIQNCHSKELVYNHSNQSGNLIEIGLKLLEKAHLKNPNNILCLLHLSNHYFLVEKYKKAEKLAKRGLWLLEQYKIIGGSNNYQSNAKGGYKFGDDIKCLRSEIYSMMGKIYHIENNYNKAYKYYSSAVQANPQNFSAIYSLGQCLFYLRNYKEALNSLKSVAAQSLYENDINLLKVLLIYTIF
jgi:RNA polymerase-associated protein CTR9